MDSRLVASLVVLLASCSRARSTPQTEAASTVPGAPAPRAAGGASAIPALARSIGALDFADDAGKTWSVKVEREHLRLARNPQLDGVKSWSQGDPFKYLLRESGEVYAQGVISAGSRTLVDYSTPQKVAGLTNVQALSVDSAGVCALSAGGKLDCFQDTVLQVPDEEYAPRGLGRSPFVTLASSGVSAVRNNCFVKDGRLSCFWLQGNDQTGQVTSHPQTTVPLEGVADYCSATNFACALVHDELWCWGESGPGDVQSDAAPSERPRPGLPGKQIASLKCAYGAVAVRTREGELWRYLGKPPWDQPHAPKRETHFRAVKDFALDDRAICGIEVDGSLRCCGQFGQTLIGGTPLPDCDAALVRAETAALPPSSAVAPSPSKSP